MASDRLSLVVFEAGVTRVVVTFYRPDERTRYEMRDAIIEIRTKDALGSDRWEHCGTMTSATTNYENKIAWASWLAWVHLAERALKNHYDSLVVKVIDTRLEPTLEHRQSPIGNTPGG